MVRWREQLHQTALRTLPPVTLFDTIGLKGGGNQGDMATCGLVGAITAAITIILLLILRPPIVVWKSKKEQVSCLKPSAVVGIGLLSGLAAAALARFG